MGQRYHLQTLYSAVNTDQYAAAMGDVCRMLVLEGLLYVSGVKFTSRKIT